MATSTPMVPHNGRRKSILDLAPLELDCMNMLWRLGEGTVRQIQASLAAVRPRAYTTIMTIMDRLARKGVVTRRKVGRAYLYRASLSAEEARTHAVAQLVAGFFGGSAELLAAHVAPAAQGLPRAGVRASVVERPRPAAPASPPAPAPAPAAVVNASAEAPEAFPATRLDESLL